MSDGDAVAAVDLSGRLGDPRVAELLGDALGAPTPARIDRAIRRYERPGRHLAGFESGGELVACLGYRVPRADSAVVEHIAVAPGRRRRGLGRMMLRWLRETAGLPSVEAETDAGAVGFYRRCGFHTARVDHPRFPEAERWRCVLGPGDPLRGPARPAPAAGAGSQAPGSSSGG